MNQFFTALALFFGEVFIIGAEMWAAKHFNRIDPWVTILPAFLISLIGLILLVYGYTFGYQAFKNIWIVTAISVSGILIVEPLVAWLLFKEIPTLGALIALILGIIGVITSISIK